MTENRPTLEPVAAVGSDVALVRVDTMKRPMVVGWPSETEEPPSTALTSVSPLGRGDDRWKVFSGLEGEEEVEEEEEEDDDVEDDVEDGVWEEDETTLDGSWALLVAPSAAVETWVWRKRLF